MANPPGVNPQTRDEEKVMEVMFRITTIHFDPNAPPPKGGNGRRKPSPPSEFAAEIENAKPAGDQTDTSSADPISAATNFAQLSLLADSSSALSLTNKQQQNDYRILGVVYYAKQADGQYSTDGWPITLKGRHLGFVTEASLSKLQELLFMARVSMVTQPQTGSDKAYKSVLMLDALLGTRYNFITEELVAQMLKTHFNMSKERVNQYFSFLNTYPPKQPTNAWNTRQFRDFLDSIDRRTPEVDIRSTLEKHSLILLPHNTAENLKLLIQCCFPQHWTDIDEMESSYPIIYNKLVRTFKDNIAVLFFKDRCKEFRLSQPMDFGTYQNWFIENASTEEHNTKQWDFLRTMRTLVHGFYPDLKKFMKNQQATCFLGGHIPDTLLSRYPIHKDDEEDKMDEESFQRIINFADHPLTKYLLKIKMLIADDSLARTVYRTFKQHFIRKMKIELLTGVANRYAPPAIVGTADPKLSRNQLEALCGPQLQFLSALSSPPGNGKTTVIENLFKVYEPSKIAAVSLAATMVDGLRARGIMADSIAMLLYRRFPNIKTSYIYNLEQMDPLNVTDIKPEIVEVVRHVKNKYDEIEGLVIDEATNVSDSDICPLLACFPNLKWIYLVFDEDQIHAIKPGRFALDVKTFMEEHQIPLVKLDQNFRMNSNPATQRILENDRMMIQGQLDKVKFSSLDLDNIQGEKPSSSGSDDDDSASGSDAKPKLPDGVYLMPYDSLADLDQKFEELFSKDPELTAFALTNKDVDHFNAIAVKVLKAKYAVPNDAVLFAKQRITVSKGFALQHISNRPLVFSDPIANGQRIRIQSFSQLSIHSTKRSWVKTGMDHLTSYFPAELTTTTGSTSTTNRVTEFNFIITDMVRELTPLEASALATMEPSIPTYADTLVAMRNAKKSGVRPKPPFRNYCLGPRGIDPKFIKNADVLTVNRSQGLEYPTSVLILPRTVEELNSPTYRSFNRHHLHVAITRSKSHLTIFGSRDVFETLARRTLNECFTMWSADMEDHFLPHFKRSSLKQAVIDNSIDAFTNPRKAKAGSRSRDDSNDESKSKSDGTTTTKPAPKKKRAPAASKEKVAPSITDIINQGGNNQQKFKSLLTLMADSPAASKKHNSKGGNEDDEMDEADNAEESSNEAAPASPSDEEIEVVESSSSSPDESVEVSEVSSKSDEVSSSSSSSSSSSESDKKKKKKKKKKSPKKKSRSNESSSSESESEEKDKLFAMMKEIQAKLEAAKEKKKLKKKKKLEAKLAKEKAKKEKELEKKQEKKKKKKLNLSKSKPREPSSEEEEEEENSGDLRDEAIESSREESSGGIEEDVPIPTDTQIQLDDDIDELKQRIEDEQDEASSELKKFVVNDDDDEKEADIYDSGSYHSGQSSSEDITPSKARQLKFEDDDDAMDVDNANSDDESDKKQPKKKNKQLKRKDGKKVSRSRSRSQSSSNSSDNESEKPLIPDDDEDFQSVTQAPVTKKRKAIEISSDHEGNTSDHSDKKPKKKKAKKNHSD